LSEDLLIAREDAIATVTFNRPQARNAMTFAMYDALADFCRAAADDPALRVVLLRGAGGEAFASGTDIAQFRDVRTAEDALAYEGRISRTLKALEECPVPTVAAIRGACTGGGAAIACCCDLRIAASDLKFGFPIARTLGNTLSLENYARMANLLGPARVKDLIFTARLARADEVAAWGLLSGVVEPSELDRAAQDLARRMAAMAPLTLRAGKKALGLLRAPVAQEAARDINLSCYLSEDFREGVAAFLAKRPPKWTGR